MVLNMRSTTIEAAGADHAARVEAMLRDFEARHPAGARGATPASREVSSVDEWAAPSRTSDRLLGVDWSASDDDDDAEATPRASPRRGRRRRRGPRPRESSIDR